MCGRYTLTTDLTRIRDEFGAELGEEIDWKPRYNIAPAQVAPIVMTPESGPSAESRQIRLARFGLIPSWAKDDKIAFKTLNARAETVAEKPAFRGAFRQRRCLIPADGFYEWTTVAGAKQPLRFVLRKEPKTPPLFAFAGLWEHWVSPQGKPVLSFSIITTEANREMRPIHDRMPVLITTPEEQALWLNRAEHDPAHLRPLLRSLPDGSLESYAVSPAVNSPRNDSARCIEPVPWQGDLFGNSGS